MTFKLRFPQSESGQNHPLTSPVIAGKMSSYAKRREVCWLLLCSAGLFSIGYTAKGILGQNVTTPLPTPSLPSLDGRTIIISPNVDTIMCPFWTQFSALFNGIDGYPYSILCDASNFSNLVRTDIPHKVHLNYQSCITQTNEGSQLDVDCMTALISERAEDDAVNDDKISDSIDDFVLYNRNPCTDDDMFHAAPCSEKGNSTYYLRGSF